MPAAEDGMEWRIVRIDWTRVSRGPLLGGRNDPIKLELLDHSGQDSAGGEVGRRGIEFSYNILESSSISLDTDFI